MKKKGLLISTIVMVVVLIAALTTSTYAWIQKTSEVTIDQIEFQVAAGADMIIGVHENNTITTGATAADFRSGSTTYHLSEGVDSYKQPGTWIGDEYLGTNIDFNGLDLQSMQKAVGTGSFTGDSAGSWDKSSGKNVWTDGTGLGGSADSSFNYTNYKTNGMIKAEGQGTTAIASTVDAAYKNFDYLDVVIGVQATKADLQTMSCYVTINPSTSGIIGMNAAIHVAYAVYNPTSSESFTETLVDHDVYSVPFNTMTSSTTISNTVYSEAKTAYDAAKDVTSSGLTCIGGPSSVELASGAMTLEIELDDLTSSDGVIDMTKIYQVHLVVYVAGFDTDCCEGAKGVGSTIYVSFAGTSKTVTE